MSMKIQSEAWSHLKKERVTGWRLSLEGCQNTYRSWQNEDLEENVGYNPKHTFLGETFIAQNGIYFPEENMYRLVLNYVPRLDMSLQEEKAIANIKCLDCLAQNQPSCWTPWTRGFSCSFQVNMPEFANQLYSLLFFWLGLVPCAVSSLLQCCVVLPLVIVSPLLSKGTEPSFLFKS